MPTVRAFQQCRVATKALQPWSAGSTFWRRRCSTCPIDPPIHTSHSPRLMKLQSEWILKGLVESIFVVGSILVALGVDEWSENRDFEELAQQSLSIFEQEIVANRARLEDVAPFHQGIRDVLAQMQLGADARINVRGVMEGLEAPVLLSTAWQTALATGALTHMEFEVVSALSLTYSIQERFASQLPRPRFVNAEGLPAGSTSEQARQAYEYVAGLSTDEVELMAVYGQALERIRAHLGINHVDADPRDEAHP